MTTIKYHWNSRLAKRILKHPFTAITFGNHIFFKKSKQDYLSIWPEEVLEKLLKHERKHVDQYRQYGFFGFLIRYAYQWARYGYYKMPLEIEARKAEKE